MKTLEKPLFIRIASEIKKLSKETKIIDRKPSNIISVKPIKRLPENVEKQEKDFYLKVQQQELKRGNSERYAFIKRNLNPKVQKLQTDNSKVVMEKNGRRKIIFEDLEEFKKNIISKDIQTSINHEVNLQVEKKMNEILTTKNSNEEISKTKSDCNSESKINENETLDNLIQSSQKEIKEIEVPKIIPKLETETSKIIDSDKKPILLDENVEKTKISDEFLSSKSKNAEIKDISKKKEINPKIEQNENQKTNDFSFNLFSNSHNPFIDSKEVSNENQKEKDQEQVLKPKNEIIPLDIFSKQATVNLFDNKNAVSIFSNKSEDSQLKTPSLTPKVVVNSLNNEEKQIEPSVKNEIQTFNVQKTETSLNPQPPQNSNNETKAISNPFLKSREDRTNDFVSKISQMPTMFGSQGQNTQPKSDLFSNFFSQPNKQELNLFPTPNFQKPNNTTFNSSLNMQQSQNQNHYSNTSNFNQVQRPFASQTQDNIGMDLEMNSAESNYLVPQYQMPIWNHQMNSNLFNQTQNTAYLTQDSQNFTSSFGIPPSNVSTLFSKPNNNVGGVSDNQNDRKNSKFQGGYKKRI